MPLPGWRARSAISLGLGMVVVVVDPGLHEDRARDAGAAGQLLVVLDGEGAPGQRRRAGRPAVAERVGVDQVLVGVEERQHRG